MDEPTAEQIQQALASRLAAVDKDKLALANAVRDCCRNLPTGKVLTVAGQKLHWIEAFCPVWGGYAWMREGSHTQRVLTLNGRLLDEPPVQITRPDSSDSFHRDGDWEGPLGGWYDLAAQEQYDKLHAEYEPDETGIEAPAALTL